MKLLFGRLLLHMWKDVLDFCFFSKFDKSKVIKGCLNALASLFSFETPFSTDEQVIGDEVHAISWQ